MKKEYQQPKATIIGIETCNIIAASDTKQASREQINYENKGWDNLWEE